MLNQLSTIHGTAQATISAGNLGRYRWGLTNPVNHHGYVFKYVKIPLKAAYVSVW